MNVRPPAADPPGLSRQAQKQRTREALLSSAQGLLDVRGLGGVSLREIAREAGVVPTAFYRHFTDMDDLGRALVAEAVRSLSDALRRSGVPSVADDPAEIEEAVARLAADVLTDRLSFVLLARERASGLAEVRSQLQAELRRLVDDVRVDLARREDLRHRSAEDLAVVAELLLDTALALVEGLVDVRPGPEQEERVRAAAVRRLELVWAGARAG